MLMVVFSSSFKTKQSYCTKYVAGAMKFKLYPNKLRLSVKYSLNKCFGHFIGYNSKVVKTNKAIFTFNSTPSNNNSKPISWCNKRNRYIFPDSRLLQVTYKSQLLATIFLFQ